MKSKNSLDRVFPRVNKTKYIYLFFLVGLVTSLLNALRPPAAFAETGGAGTRLVVNEIKKDQKRIMLKGTAKDSEEIKSLNPGKVIPLRFDDGRTCELEVLETKGNQVKTDGLLCPHFADIRVGMTTNLLSAPTPATDSTRSIPDSAPAKTSDEQSTLDPVAKDQNPPKRPSKFSFDFGGFYNFADELKFKGKYEPSKAAFSGKIETQPGYGFSVWANFRENPDTRLFISASLSLEIGRNIKKMVRTKGPILGTATDADDAVVALFGITSQINYEIAPPVFLTAGLSYQFGSITLNDPLAVTGNGIQLGVGAHFERRFWTELNYRIVSLSGVRDVNGTSGIDSEKYTSIILSGLILSARFTFK